jgi:hypothetical protein
LIDTMLNQKEATGNANPALNFATDLAREGFRAPVNLSPSVCRLRVTETLRVLSNSSVPKPADNIGGLQ